MDIPTVKAYVLWVGVTIIRLFTDILSYIRIPLILLYSHLFLCPTYVRLFLMFSGNYSSNEIFFFLRILVERIFCFHMGISLRWGGRGFPICLSQGFPICLCFSQGFPIYSLIFGYSLIVIGYSAIDLSAQRQTSPLPIAPQKCYRGRFVQGYVSIARIMSHRTRRQDVGQSRCIPSGNLTDYCVCAPFHVIQDWITLFGDSRRTPASQLLIQPMPKGDKLDL